MRLLRRLPAQSKQCLRVRSALATLHHRSRHHHHLAFVCNALQLTATKQLLPRTALLLQIKTEEEVRIMRYVAQVASAAHVEVMRHCKWVCL